MPSNGANNLKAAKKIASSYANKGYPTTYIIKNTGGRYPWWVKTKGRSKKGVKGKIRRIG